MWWKLFALSTVIKDLQKIITPPPQISKFHFKDVTDLKPYDNYQCKNLLLEIFKTTIRKNKLSLSIPSRNQEVLTYLGSMVVSWEIRRLLASVMVTLLVAAARWVSNSRICCLSCWVNCQKIQIPYHSSFDQKDSMCEQILKSYLFK